MQERNIDIIVTSPPGPAIEKFKKIPSIKIYKTGNLIQFADCAGIDNNFLRSLYSLRFWRNLNQLKNIIINENPDIVHLNEVGLIFVAKLVKKLGIKVVMHVRVAINQRWSIINTVSRFFINRYVDILIPIDQAASLSLKVDIKKVVVYNPIEQDPSNQSQLFPKASSGLNIIFMANWLKQKGIYDVLKIAKRLLDYKHIRFFVAGQSTFRQHEYKKPLMRFFTILGFIKNHEKKIKEIITKHNLTNIKLIGYVDNIGEIFSTMDINLLPSYMNQPSRSIYEAGKHYVPTIFTMKKKVEDIIENNKTGYIFAEGDIKGITDLIVRLEVNRNELVEMGKLCNYKYTKLHDPNQGANKIMEIYLNLINSTH